MPLFGVTALFQEEPRKDKQWRPEDNMRIEQMEYIQELSEEEAQTIQGGRAYSLGSQPQTIQGGDTAQLSQLFQAYSDPLGTATLVYSLVFKFAEWRFLPSGPLPFGLTAIARSSGTAAIVSIR